MRTTRWFALPALVAALSVPEQSSAQIPALGVYGAYHTDGSDGVFDAVPGAGLRMTLGFPILPVDFVVGAEYFFPDCGQLLGEDLVCAFAGAEASVNYSPLPVPVVSPYVSAGIVLRAVKPPELDPSYDTEQGFSLGLGVSFNPIAIPFGLFLEARKEWVFEDVDSTILRAGLELGG